MSYSSLELDVIRWAEARQIIRNSHNLAQAHKTAEESAELLEAAASIRLLDQLCKKSPELANHPEIIRALSQQTEAYKDALGDVLVTLIVGSATAKVDLMDCLKQAYNEIKDRKGHLREDGVFVKDA